MVALLIDDKMKPVNKEHVVYLPVHVILANGGEDKEHVTLHLDVHSRLQLFPVRNDLAQNGCQTKQVEEYKDKQEIDGPQSRIYQSSHVNTQIDDEMRWY